MAALVVLGVAVVASLPHDTPGPGLPSISAPAEPGPLHTSEGLERMLAATPAAAPASGGPRA